MGRRRSGPCQAQGDELSYAVGPALQWLLPGWTLPGIASASLAIHSQVGWRGHRGLSLPPQHIHSYLEGPKRKSFERKLQASLL